MIPYNDFYRLLTDVSDCPDFDAYLAEVGGSIPLDDADAVVRILSTIWEMGREGLTIKSIATACGVSVRRAGIDCGIPQRTIENWASGTTVPPAWQLPLIAYATLSNTIDQR